MRRLQAGTRAAASAKLGPAMKASATPDRSFPASRVSRIRTGRPRRSPPWASRLRLFAKYAVRVRFDGPHGLPGDQREKRRCADTAQRHRRRSRDAEREKRCLGTSPPVPASQPRPCPRPTPPALRRPRKIPRRPGWRRSQEMSQGVQTPPPPRRLRASAPTGLSRPEDSAHGSDPERNCVFWGTAGKGGPRGSGGGRTTANSEYSLT